MKLAAWLAEATRVIMIWIRSTSSNSSSSSSNSSSSRSRSSGVGGGWDVCVNVLASFIPFIEKYSSLLALCSRCYYYYYTTTTITTLLSLSTTPLLTHLLLNY